MAMTPKEQLDIIAAYVAGKEIQQGGCWDSTWDKAVICGEGHQFNFEAFDYRIKPKPLERWINVCDTAQDDQAYETKEIARMAACKSCRTVHMREVLGD